MKKKNKVKKIIFYQFIKNIYLLIFYQIKMAEFPSLKCDSNNIFLSKYF